MRTTIALLACSLLGHLELQAQARSWSTENGIGLEFGGSSLVDH